MPLFHWPADCSNDGLGARFGTSDALSRYRSPLVEPRYTSNRSVLVVACVRVRVVETFVQVVPTV
jgi:hypothetical protein